MGFKVGILALVVALFTTMSNAQYAVTLQPDVPQDWEADVTPPPPDEWMNNMPRGPLPRALPGHPLRVFYLVPSNRTAQPDAIPRIQSHIVTLKDYFREQMERNGFGPKTISFETEADGVTPKIHVVNAPNLDSYYRAVPWPRVYEAAQAAGLPVWRPGEVWLGIYEAHLMNPDGSVSGNFNGGSNQGSGSSAGLGLTCSNSLAHSSLDYMTSDTAYNGKVLPELGPYPMVYGVTAPTFEGTTIGNLASVRLGVVFHELAHGYALEHDFRNDLNFYGNLLGNGFRGIRSWVEPQYRFDEECRLGYASALVLSVNRYFNGDQTYTDNAAPLVNAQTLGSVVPVNGLLPFRFTATDTSGMAAATLLLNDNVIDEVALSSTSVDHTFHTPYYEPGVTNQYKVCVFDVQGNKRTLSIGLTPVAGSNRAPRPFAWIKPETGDIETTFSMRSGFSQDPDHSISQLTVEWDLNGDGTFDTAPAPTFDLQHQYDIPGTYMVRCRVTDPAGAASVSTPIAVKVVGPDSRVEGWELF